MPANPGTSSSAGGKEGNEKRELVARLNIETNSVDFTGGR